MFIVLRVKMYYKCKSVHFSSFFDFATTLLNVC